MKINSGDLIKKIRKDMGISQEDLAAKLFISTRHFSRIENGATDIDIWQFVAILELLGQPTEDFWLIYLESSEYDEYSLYKQLKRLLRNKQFSEAKETLIELEQKNLSKKPFISQFILLAKVLLDKEMPIDTALSELHKAIHMSIPNFDENKVHNYRLTYNEMSVINEIALKLGDAGEKERAIDLIKLIVESRERVRATDDDKTIIFPSLMFNLSNILGKSARYKESLKYCEKAIEICREYNNLRLIPQVLYNMACCYLMLGEEEQIYKPHLIRAYHCAYAIGNYEIANIIKQDAEKDFNILLA